MMKKKRVPKKSKFSTTSSAQWIEVSNSVDLMRPLATIGRIREARAKLMLAWANIGDATSVLSKKVAAAEKVLAELEAAAIQTSVAIAVKTKTITQRWDFQPKSSASRPRP